METKEKRNALPAVPQLFLLELITVNRLQLGTKDNGQCNVHISTNPEYYLWSTPNAKNGSIKSAL